MERHRILVVERGPKLRAALLHLMAETGHEAVAVASGDEALAKLQAQQFSLLLTELDLDDMDGISLARSARGISPQIRVIVLTTTEDISYAVLALRAEVDDFFVKQRDGIDDLKRGIARALGKERAAAAPLAQPAQGDHGELLAEIDDLNEGFLKNMITLDKELADLKERIAGGADDGKDDTYRVLVVDDEEIILTVLDDLLAGEGFTVRCVATAEIAVDTLSSEKFDLVVTDKNLPKMSGLDLIRHVKTAHPDVEAIMITGYASMESAVQALDLGAAGYLLKPFSDIRIILDKVQEVRKRQVDRGKARRYFQSFKHRNEQFLERYRMIKQRLASASKA